MALKFLSNATLLATVALAITNSETLPDTNSHSRTWEFV